MVRPARRQLALDLLPIIVVCAFHVGFVVSLGMPSQPRDWSNLVLAAITTAALFWRRHRPRTVLAVSLAAEILIVGAGELAPGTVLPAYAANTTWITLAAPFAAYAAATYAAQHWDTWVALVLFSVLATRPWEWDLLVWIGGLLLVTAPAVLGLYTGARRRLTRALRDRVTRAEREQRLLADRARVAERERLAAEMHDVVSHRISLMVLRAGALGVTAPSEETRRAAKEIGATGHHALEELRELLSVLRDPTAAPRLTAPGSTSRDSSSSEVES